MAKYADERDVRASTSEILLPPRRSTPSQAAASSLRTEKGAWDPALTPMLLEPLDALGSREYTGIVFVGPARTGKTMSLILGGITYIVTCSPGDSLVVGMSQDTVRDFSRSDLDRAIRYSPELAARLSPRAKDDNTYDKFFRSGIVLKLGWPAVSQLSSKTLRYVFLTDYDRPENRDDVDGEGPMWDLAAKRTETFMSRGKCVAESSPGEDYLDAKWKPATPHEAPPALGILSLYNRGTRARWHWPCQHCGGFFEAQPGLGSFAMPPFEQLLEAVKTADPMTLAHEFARVVCPHCGGLHEMPDRPAMNKAGVWVHEGQRVVDGKVEGERRRTNIASYWLGGVAAAYQRWDSIALKYLQAVATFARTGDEMPLKATTNTDQGAPYMPRAALRRRASDDLVKRREDWPRGVVPQGVRFLTGAVDIQGNRFVCSVYGWGEYLESWLVDRWSITGSERLEDDGRHAALDPASYAEDWHVLRTAIIGKRYPVDGVPGAELPVLLTLCDSGGRDGVTMNAYTFWRELKALGLGKKFMLVKGVGNVNAARTVMTWPDNKGNAQRHSGARGDVPVWLINTNVLKDAIFGDLGRETRGPGYCHLPMWVDDEYFEEMAAETRTTAGWKVRPGERNEAIDLHVYARAACIVLGAEKINWDQPPEWATVPAARQAQAAAPQRQRRVLSSGI